MPELYLPVRIWRTWFVHGLGALTLLTGCTDLRTPDLAVFTGALDAVCTAQVVGIGAVDTESQYLPRVVMCENGGADFEALKAQAVAARSVLYYKMANGGSIRDGQSDQVYSCGREPGDLHRLAVAETAGQVATFRNAILFAFYVAGAIPSTGDCVPAAGDRDPTSTEHWVTYNWGRSGDAVEQTALGWVNRGNLHNRGCQSQNGAHCLAEHGWGYRDILSFYYGMDIELVTAQGACVQDPGCAPEIAGQGETIIDDRSGCFVRGACDSWREEPQGHAGHLSWTYAWDQAADCTARWRLSFTAAGSYRLAVWIADFGNRSVQVPYLIRHGGRETEHVLSQAQASGWLELGTFDFAQGGDQWVQLHDATGEPYAQRRQILVDALRVTRDEPEPECRTDADCGDGDVCNGAETCQQGACVGGNAPDCSAAPACTTARCDPARGCVLEPVADGTPCPGGRCRGGSCLVDAADAGFPGEPDAGPAGSDLGQPEGEGQAGTDGGPEAEGADPLEPEGSSGSGALDSGRPGVDRRFQDQQEGIRGEGCGLASHTAPSAPEGLLGLLLLGAGVGLLRRGSLLPKKTKKAQYL